MWVGGSRFRFPPVEVFEGVVEGSGRFAAGDMAVHVEWCQRFYIVVALKVRSRSLDADYD